MSCRHKQVAPVWARETVISQRAKSTFALAMLIAIVITLGSVVFANSPGVAGSVTVTVERLPANAAYVDLMVKFDETNDLYTQCSDWVTKDAGLSEDSDLVRLAAGGYRSYAAHAKDAEPLMNLLEGEPVQTVQIRFWNNRLPIMNDMFPFIKVALFDASGALVRISPEINVNPSVISFSGQVKLNGQTGQVSTDYSIYPFGLIFYFIGYLFVPWAITVVTETVIGVIFKIRPVKYVFLINGVSNLTMNALIFLALMIINRALLPIPLLLAIELGVVVCEYLIYRRKYTTISNHRLLTFSIIANASSLMIGLGFNSMLWNVWGL